jgi:tricorn protease
MKSVLRAHIASLFVLMIIQLPCHSQEPIRFPRTPDISPDGKLVAFSYLGDIWTVEAIGGVARPVTMHEAHEINPCFSPDGRWIAFSSNRHGSYDVFVVAAHGGRPKRLTFDSAHDMAMGWTPDGKGVIFSSTRSTNFPPSPEMYVVPFEGGRERPLPFVDAKELALCPTGGHAAFSRGPGIWYRKGYRGSSNDDIWLANAEGTVVRRLTDFNGQDTSPMWSPDGRKIYYVSELGGNPANVICQDLNPSGSPPQADGKPRSITHHKEDGVRRARISANGEWIVYECGCDIWMTSTRDGTPRKLAIEVHADDKSNSERIVTFTRDVTEYAPSPDDSHIAFVVHGEIFIMPARGGKATRLTDSYAIEHGISWSPDGNSILYVADQNGRDDLFLLQSDDPEHPELTKAHRFKSKQLTNTAEAEAGASFSPDGTRIMFLRGGKLWTMKPDGSQQKVLVDRQQVFDYDWSPDGKWIVFAQSDGSFASEIYLMPIDGSQPPKNVTRYATFNGDVSWNNTGNKIAFLSQRRGTYAMHVLALQKPAASVLNGSPATTPADSIDWDDIHLRTSRPGNNLASSGTISRNGKWIAFRNDPGDDLWLVNVDGSVMQRMTYGAVGPKMIRWSKSSQTLWFLDGTGAIRNIGLGLGGIPTSAGPPTVNTVAFTAKMTIRREEEFAQMFEQCWRGLEQHFYDSKYHGVDWKAVRERYRPLVQHVAMKEDLYALISLMLGELNASHLGITGPGRVPEEVTADLGIIFDESYRGPGLRIAEILKHGPADKRNLNFKPGEIVLSIDRTEITDKTNISTVLNGKVNETVLIEISSNPADPKAKRRFELKATDRGQVASLMYQRWVAKNAESVAQQSKGTLGYIHIPSMDERGLEQFVRSLYSDNFDKDAIVIDVRYNGGGFTHDQVLNYLGAKEHTHFRQRDGGEGAVMRSYDRKWTKPSVVLVNNRSFSDAEIFPSAFRTLGLGKVVGQTTGGMVIGTGSTRLIDSSTFRLPRTGVFTVKGVNMEKEGVVPDVPVEALPEDLAKGNDAQLRKSVEVLFQDVAAWKKSHGAVASAPGTGGAAPMPPITAPMPMPAPK